MKARCRCGHIIEYPPQNQGKRTKCPNCGKAVRLPGGSVPRPEPASPPSPQQEEEDSSIEFDWGDEFSLEGEEEHSSRLEEASSAGAVAEPDSSPGAKQPAGSSAVDWGDEFGLELDDKPQSQDGAPPERVPAPRPAPRPAADEDDLGLAFDSGEFDVGAVEDDGEPIDLGADQILGMSGAAAVPVDEAARAATAPPAGGAMRICRDCGMVITDDVPVCPDCGAGLTAAGAPRKKVVQRREAEEVPTNIFALILMCIRRPSMVGDIGAGGIDGPLRLQVFGGFALMLVLTALVNVLGKSVDSEFGPFGASGVGGQIIINIVEFFAVVLAMYVLATMVRGSVGFMSIVSGLAFVRVMSGVLFIPVALIGGIAVFLAQAEIIPLGMAVTLGGAPLLVVGILTFIYQIYFIMGVYDMGCFGAFCVNIFAGMLAGGIQIYVGAVVLKVMGVI